LKLDLADCGEERNSEGEIINIKAIFDQVNAGTQMSKVELHHGETSATPHGLKKIEKAFERVEKVDRSQSPMTYSSGHRYRKLPRTAMKKYEDLRIHEERLSEGLESPLLSQNHGLSSQDTRAIINRDIMKRERKKRSRSKRKKLSYVKSQPIENYMSDSFETSPHQSKMKDTILNKGRNIVGRLRPSTSKRRNRMLNQPSFFKSKGLLYPVDSSSKQLTVLTHQKEYNGNDTIGWNEQRAFDYERELEEYRI